MDIEELRAFCLSMPNATEDIKWGSDLCFCIKEKMFCVTDLNTTPLGITIKTTPDTFDELVEHDFLVPAKYLARYKWVSLTDVNQLDVERLHSLIQTSYELVLKKAR